MANFILVPGGELVLDRRHQLQTCLTTLFQDTTSTDNSLEAPAILSACAASFYLRPAPSHLPASSSCAICPCRLPPARLPLSSSELSSSYAVAVFHLRLLPRPTRRLPPLPSSSLRCPVFTVFFYALVSMRRSALPIILYVVLPQLFLFVCLTRSCTVHHLAFFHQTSFHRSTTGTFP